MALQLGSAEAEDEVLATINTTPLVDVMLVLLIIFLITIPVVVHTAPVELPRETNQPTQTKPENVVISVKRDGAIFWNLQPLADHRTLVDKLKEIALMQPQPEVHVRGDRNARYDSVGKVVYSCQRAGILKIGFITEPPSRSL